MLFVQADRLQNILGILYSSFFFLSKSNPSRRKNNNRLRRRIITYSRLINDVPQWNLL